LKRDEEQLNNIYPLKDGFGLLNEGGDETYFVSLISLDLNQHILKKLHTIEYPTDYIKICINRADSITFLLNDFNNAELQLYKIVDKEIIIKDVIDIDFFPECFYDKCVYNLGWLDEDRNHLKVRMLYMPS
jgi:hypothetical protein